MNGGITLRRFVTPAFRIRASTIRGAVIRGALPALAGALVLAGCGAAAAVTRPARPPPRPPPGPPPARQRPPG